MKTVTFSSLMYGIGLSFLCGLSLGVYLHFRGYIEITDDCPPCDMVHCTPEDTMKDLSVLELEPGESLTVTNQNGTIVYRKALSK